MSVGGIPLSIAGPNLHTIVMLASAKATVGTWAYNASSAIYFNGYYGNTGSSALNDSVTTYEVWLKPGTWQIDCLGLTGTDAGIATVYLIGPDGTLTNATTWDLYLGSAIANRTTLATNFTVAKAGLYSVKFTATSKNASSSAYRIRVSAAILTKSA